MKIADLFPNPHPSTAIVWKLGFHLLYIQFLPILAPARMLILPTPKKIHILI